MVVLLNYPILVDNEVAKVIVVVVVEFGQTTDIYGPKPQYLQFGLPPAAHPNERPDEHPDS